VRDDEDFAEYVTANGDRLLRLAYLMTGDRVAAQDAVQAVLGRALLSWRRIANDNPDAYLRRAILNERTSVWRRWGRREVTSDVVPVRHSDDHSGRADRRADLMAALRKLPPGQRAVIALRYLEDLPDEAVADIVQCSPATVRSQAFRGLAKLRTLLDLPEDATTPSHLPRTERTTQP
jgi:RNA polymerase sigma-70 factor (sigma-E family)